MFRVHTSRMEGCLGMIFAAIFWLLAPFGVISFVQFASGRTITPTFDSYMTSALALVLLVAAIEAGVALGIDKAKNTE